MTLHTYTPNQCPYQVSTSYTLRLPRFSPDKILKVKVTMARSKVKSRSHHDVVQLQPLTNVPTKYQLPTPYGCRDIARTRFFPPPTQPPARTPAHPDTMGENNTCLWYPSSFPDIDTLFVPIMSVIFIEPSTQSCHVPRNQPITEPLNQGQKGFGSTSASCKAIRDTSIALKHRRCRYPTAWRNSFQHHEIQNLTKVSTFYILRNPRNSPDKILKLMFTMTRSKVQSRPHHYDAHLWPLTNVLDSLPSINFLHLTVSEI